MDEMKRENDRLFMNLMKVFNEYVDQEVEEVLRLKKECKKLEKEKDQLELEKQREEFLKHNNE